MDSTGAIEAIGPEELLEELRGSIDSGGVNVEFSMIDPSLPSVPLLTRIPSSRGVCERGCRCHARLLAVEPDKVVIAPPDCPHVAACAVPTRRLYMTHRLKTRWVVWETEITDVKPWGSVFKAVWLTHPEKGRAFQRRRVIRERVLDNTLPPSLIRSGQAETAYDEEPVKALVIDISEAGVGLGVSAAHDDGLREGEQYRLTLNLDCRTGPVTAKARLVNRFRRAPGMLHAGFEFTEIEPKARHALREVTMELQRERLKRERGKAA